MQISELEFLNLKKQTFKNLLSKSDEITKLILSTLIISLCHDKCIKDEELNVSIQFINECASKINLTPNINIDSKTKITLIRNKLAHGDYAYNENNRTIVINYLDNYLEVPVNNIIELANCISNYYKYLSKDQDRISLVCQYGLELLITDHCKKNKGRDYSYNKNFEHYVNLTNLAHPIRIPVKDGKYILPDFFTRKKFSLERREMTIDYEILSETNKKTGIIYNPYGSNLLKNIVNLLNSKEPLELNYYDKINYAINSLIDFYIFYIYPLDNFMKLDDQGIKKLPNDTNFDFSKLDLHPIRNDDTFDNVGKIKNYPDDLISLYKNIHQLETKLIKLEQQKHKNTDYSKIKSTIETEIEELLNIALSNPITRLYDYSKNRSLLEHIRCSIMHGNYDYDELSNTYTFFDYWKDKECYRDQISLLDFEKLFNLENLSLVVNQNKTINERKK